MTEPVFIQLGIGSNDGVYHVLANGALRFIPSHVATFHRVDPRDWSSKAYKRRMPDLVQAELYARYKLRRGRCDKVRVVERESDLVSVADADREVEEARAALTRAKRKRQARLSVIFGRARKVTREDCRLHEVG